MSNYTLSAPLLKPNVSLILFQYAKTSTYAVYLMLMYRNMHAQFRCECHIPYVAIMVLLSICHYVWCIFRILADSLERYDVGLFQQPIKVTHSIIKKVSGHWPHLCPVALSHVRPDTKWEGWVTVANWYPTATLLVLRREVKDMEKLLLLLESTYFFCI